MDDWKADLPSAAFVFRGYNIKNLGRTAELLAHRAYGPIVERYLLEAGEVYAAEIGLKVDLAETVRRHEEPPLERYAESVALIVAVEQAQLHLLREFFGIDNTKARLAYGYSLGEIAALVAGGAFEMRHALCIPLALARDCAELARDVTLGVLFSRGPARRGRRRSLVPADQRDRAGSDRGLVVSSPNSLLLLGQGDTMDHFAELMHEWLPQKRHPARTMHHWPPLHTPIMWQRTSPTGRR